MSTETKRVREIKDKSWKCIQYLHNLYSIFKSGILERLAAGPVIGDGGFIFELEKRGYVKAGPWTPEATVEHPEAVRQLHREFLRAGADVMQVKVAEEPFTLFSNSFIN